MGHPEDQLRGIDVARVNRWLQRHTPLPTPVEFDLIAKGGSNLTFRLTDAAGARWVLRRPPVGQLLQSAHDVVREHRILGGLAATAVPVPEVVAVCDDPEVNDAPFFVMRYVEGIILRSSAMGAELGPERAHRAGAAFFEALATIHRADLEPTGLTSLSRSHGYVERQLRRWHAQYLQTAGAKPFELEAKLHQRLSEVAPPDVAPGEHHLVHGDYHIDNVVFDGDMVIQAIFDWELATLGHPIADLAWALMFWVESYDEETFLGDAPTAAPGFPTRAEATDVYRRATGYHLESLPYFEAFSLWKMACLLTGSLYRSRRGEGGGLQAQGDAPRSDLRARIGAMFDRADTLLDALC